MWIIRRLKHQRSSRPCCEAFLGTWELLHFPWHTSRLFVYSVQGKMCRRCWIQADAHSQQEIQNYFLREEKGAIRQLYLYFFYFMWPPKMEVPRKLQADFQCTLRLSVNISWMSVKPRSNSYALCFCAALDWYLILVTFSGTRKILHWVVADLIFLLLQKVYCNSRKS